MSHCRWPPGFAAAAGGRSPRSSVHRPSRGGPERLEDGLLLLRTRRVLSRVVGVVPAGPSPGKPARSKRSVLVLRQGESHRLVRVTEVFSVDLGMAASPGYDAGGVIPSTA